MDMALKAKKTQLSRSLGRLKCTLGVFFKQSAADMLLVTLLGYSSNYAKLTELY